MAVERVPRRRYVAASGAPFTDEQADRYGRFLEEKVGLGRRIVPTEEIVEASRPKGAPTHEFVFALSDEDAAHEHRLDQARYLMGHLHYYAVESEPEGSESVRAFHNVVGRVEIKSNGETGYKTVRGYTDDREIWRRPELAEQVIERARRELESWSDRYVRYEELAELREKIAEALDETREEAVESSPGES